MPKKYNKVPFGGFDDPKEIWRLQISGKKNFDEYSFMGALNDLQNVPDWRSVFDPIQDEVGMSAFLDRLEKHFELCKLPITADGRQFFYMHPNRTHDEAGFDKDKMIELTKRHMESMIKAFSANGQPDEANKLRGIDVHWADPEFYNRLDFDEQRELWDGGPLGFYLSDAWDFADFLDDVPDIAGCLYEASYSLANDFALTRYLVQSFMDHGLDVDAEYELKWVHKGAFYFDENSCYVTVVQ